MILKTTEEQAKRVHQLVREQCANCVDGNCLFLDDGEEHTCVQFLSLYGIYCKYFNNAVLTTDKELYQEIANQNKFENETEERK
jgi:hypothetical protein